jgi:hypothetical protein
MSEKFRYPTLHWLATLVALCNVLVIACAGLTFLLIGGGAILRFFVLYAIAVVLSSMLPMNRLGSR